MNTIFLPPAEEEMIAAGKYYEELAHGLGLDFFDEVEKTISQISKYPQSGPEIHGNIRRRIIHRFPFGVLYKIDNDVIVIIAIMNLYRKPGYWKSRLDTETQ
ncbi:type II toxin-antitoxin system RelE/ParE family toxin [Planctomycetota bacterium]